MAKTRVDKPSDLVKEGDEVTGWVTKSSKKENRVGLSQVEPPSVDWADLKVGQIFNGKVTRVENFGAFVDIGAEREGIVHVSEMETGYVPRPSDVVKVGDEVEVRVIEINPKKRQIKLSMKMDLSHVIEVEEVEEAALPQQTVSVNGSEKEIQRNEY